MSNSEKLDDMTSQAVKGFDPVLKEHFKEAIEDVDFCKYMELSEDESDMETLAYLMKRLRAEMYYNTRCIIESEYDFSD